MAEKSTQDSKPTGDGANGIILDDLSSEENKRLLRKIDSYLLPIMAVSYMFQFLDKSALGFSAVMNLSEDLSLKGDDFSWASSIYYFGYLVASYPAGFIMVRFRVAKTIAFAVVFWGIVLMLTAAVSNAAGLLSIRLILGVAEAPIAPGLTVIISMWYRRSEQPLRMAGWYVGNSIAGIFGGIAAYGIGHIDTISSWKAMFLIFGGATVAWSIAIFTLLPDVPMTAWFLNDEDRNKSVIRVQENMTGIKSDQFKWSQCREALLDPNTWFIALIQLSGNIPNGGMSSFGSLILKGLGFGTFPTLLLQSASYIVQLVLVLVGTTGSAYLPNCRTYFLMCDFILAIVGTSMISQLPASHRWARYGGYCVTMAYSANFPLVLSMTSGNIGGFTKKTTVNAVSFIAYCVGNIIGPQLFFAREAPTYHSGFLAMVVSFGFGLLTCIVWRGYLIWENRRRDHAHVVSETAEGHEQVMINLEDKTDREIPEFRYVY